MKTILLIMIGLSSFAIAQETQRFTKENGVVTDTQTTLEWQDDYSDNANNIKSAKWTDAIDYCEGLSLNSQEDWRLPNKKELLSIADYSTYNQAISSVFENTISSFYWTSTTYVTSTHYAWSVFFGYSITFFRIKSSNSYVRCVRAGE